jgi:glycosyltransferase involved in cell wall biosynthesis
VNVWFVTPAWRRFAVTRLALAQRRQLCDELAVRGITADCIVVADDDNLQIADEFGFKSLARPNLLGYKLNSGVEMALELGADYVSFVGSDDWIHADLFVPEMLDGRAVISGAWLCQYDLASGTSKVVTTRNRFGVIPWLIPRGALPAGPVVPHNQETGLDIHLGMALGNVEWRYHDPHPLTRVDFKSDVGLTPFGAGIGRVAPPLRDFYPEDLVALADDFMAVAA